MPSDSPKHGTHVHLLADLGPEWCAVVLIVANPQASAVAIGGECMHRGWSSLAQSTVLDL